MLSVLYILIIVVGITVQNAVRKPYTDKNGGRGSLFFSGVSSLFALLFFLVTASGLSFNIKILPYSALFAVFYCFANISALLATSCGSLALTSLFISYSLMIPTFYGLIFLKESVSIGFIPGIILLAVSLFLINGRVRVEKISLKWVIYTAVALVSNGMCSVVQNAQQTAFAGEFKNEFMISALTLVTLAMAVLTVLKERGEIKEYLKSGLKPAAAGGVMNGAVNLFVMLVTGIMSVSLAFPLISAGSIIATYGVSRIIYRERLSKLQLAGFIVGIGSVVFLNI